MFATSVHSVQCPYCGEDIELVIDASLADQEYIEDCSVCCRPITLQVWVEGEEIRLNARQENDC